MSGTGVLVLLAVWLAHVHVRHEFESRSRHKVSGCPCCLGGAVVVLLCATTTLNSCREKKQAEVAGTLDSATTLETFVLSVGA